MKVLHGPVPEGPDGDDYWRTGTRQRTLVQRYRTLNCLSQSERPADETERAYVDSMLRSLYNSPYSWAIVPLQDLLYLGAEARMNMPSVAEGNWAWRAKDGLTDRALKERMLALTKSGSRC